MKALTYIGIEQIHYETIADPEILDAADVIVKVTHCAICGSDLHPYFGREKGLDSHTAMGHEFIGEVVEKGRAVRSLSGGDMVMSPFTTSCGNCYYCKTGLTCRCEHGQLFGWVEHGKGLHGGQAEYVRVPMADTTLRKIPEGISHEEALLLGDVLSTGFFCAHQAGIKPGEIYAVIGCGPVGLMTVCAAIALGAEHVFAIDTVEARLRKARAFGARPIDASTQDPVELIRNATSGRGADGVMEAVGSESSGRLAYELLRPGGVISAVGVCTSRTFPFSPTDAYNKNVTYKVGRSPARRLMDELIPFVRKTQVDLTSVISHHMRLSEGVHAYDIFANKKDDCLKVVMTV